MEPSKTTLVSFLGSRWPPMPGLSFEFCTLGLGVQCLQGRKLNAEVEAVVCAHSDTSQSRVYGRGLGFRVRV